MIRGQVNKKLEARVSFRLRGPTGIELVVDATVDTGFSGELTLTAATVATLGLKRRMGGIAVLADGSSCSYDVYPAEVEWDGVWQKILVWEMGEALIGMSLLSGYALLIEVKPTGSVVIDRMP